jgi:hypothetical protein
MNRRDFIKSLSAFGLYLALPTELTLPAEKPKDFLGAIYTFSCDGVGKESRPGEARLMRGSSTVLSFPLNVFGGAIYWQCPPGSEIIYDNNLTIEVSPLVVAHTAVLPINGGQPMYWGAENIDGKSVETWLPLYATT